MSKNNDTLGSRMKTFYEAIPKTRLMRRTPVAIRIDGKAFHTLTQGLKRPFDEVFQKSMRETMLYLCKNIQGCVLGYTQSDEITLILVDYKHLNSEAWFDYEVQKMCSISASMATMAFNKVFKNNVDRAILEYKCSQGIEEQEKAEKYHNSLLKAVSNGAMFDSRCFNIPKEEVANLLYWRQLDAEKNSTQMIGRAYFSHKQLEGKHCEEIAEMLEKEKGIKLDHFLIHQRRGCCALRGELVREWYVDLNIPKFVGADREYIEKFLLPEEE